MPPAHGMNHILKDEIRAYWGKRSETFDLAPTHRIRSEGEFAAWRGALAAVLPEGRPLDVVELGFGFGDAFFIAAAEKPREKAPAGL